MVSFNHTRVTVCSRLELDSLTCSVCLRRCISHLKEILRLGHRDMEWVDAAKEYPDLLSYYGRETLGANFTGAPDLLAASRSAIKAHQPEKGMHLLIDVWKTVGRSEMARAQAKLLLANVHSPDTKPAMVSP